MAALGSQTIASSYEQLLHVDRDGGGNGTTLVDVKDGDNGTTFALKLAQFHAEIRGTTGTGATGAGKLNLSTSELTVVDNDVLGRIDFLAPLESSGTDAILAGASIWGEAEDTFAADNNSTALVFATNTSAAATERMRISSAGNVGIGNTAEVNFHIKLADTANARIEDPSSDGNAKLDFKNDVRQATIGVYGDDSDNFKIDHGGGTVMSIDTSQVVYLEIGQLKFPASQNASSNANTLDDYEEGTWTPTLTTSGTDFDSVSYNADTGGLYTKIGRVIHLQGAIRTSALTAGSASGSVKIGGLPFTPANHTTEGDAGFFISYATGFAGETPIIAHAERNGTNLVLYFRTTADDPVSALQVADVDGSLQFNFHGSFVDV